MVKRHEHLHLLSEAKGAMTLFTLLVTMTLVAVFIMLFAFGTRQSRHAERLRIAELGAQSMLHFYDRQLLEKYSLPAVDIERAKPSAYLDAGSATGPALFGAPWSWQFEPLETLDSPEVFLQALKASSALNVTKEALTVFEHGIQDSRQDLTSGTLAGEDLLPKERFPDLSVYPDRIEGQGTPLQWDMALEAVRWIRNGESASEMSSTTEGWHPEKGAASPDDSKSLKEKAVRPLPSEAYSGSIEPLMPAERMIFAYYASRHFRHRVNDPRRPYLGKAAGPTYLRSELEYLLYGHDSEGLNNARAYGELFAWRLAGNSAHVAMCRHKQTQIAGFSSAVAAVFGVPPPLTTGALNLTWAVAETCSDMKRLLDGEALPWVHITDWAWRTGFGGTGPAANHDGNSGEAGMSQGSGLFLQSLDSDAHGLADYGDHLAARLAAGASTRHLLRTLDLIAVNLSTDSLLALEQRVFRFRILLKTQQGLPEVILEEGYGLD